MRRIRLIIQSLLILFLLYPGLDKLLNWSKNYQAIHNQVFPEYLADILAFAVPCLEIGLAILLIFKKTRWWGFLGSSLLLTIFTTYIGLIWVGSFPRVPCSCAGIFDSIGWQTHFYINLLFIGFSIWGLSIPANENKLSNLQSEIKQE
ncbi:MauE/DoxX family redox-associated membrane protein [Algoriphagus sp. PAP.12]|uniref:MauE/DoxX family redox-associated membrane protein n=1 Tax=Algoriphagus sp. PAP.12 TaxID=2996678 RepID=UPI003FA38622